MVKEKAPNTLEAKEAMQSGYFSRALRRVAKRRQAFSQASPYLVGIVGLADTYEYIGGQLCYIIEERPKRWLRILDLHSAPDSELVIDIPKLVGTAVPQSAKSRKYKFRILYHADGITSCLFSFALPNTENWLLIFNAQKHQILEKCRLESTSRIFVRNNEDYLYFGTHSEEGADGFRKWVIRGFDFRSRSWLPTKMHLSNLVGYDIGFTVCFEIIDNYFYGLSNQTTFEVEEVDWTSYYYCFRFRLSEPDPRKTQVMKKDDSWRRQHAEGPIDDRWGFLRLEKGDATGSVKIVESRKEWLVGMSGSRRTYYTQEVRFREEPNHEPNQEPREDSPASGSALPDTGSATAIGHMSQSKSVTPQTRSPHHVHPGDNSSTTSLFTRSKTYLCSYQAHCHTFIDLLDHTTTGRSDSPTLRLRSGHRKRKPISGSTGDPPPLSPELNVDEKIRLLYQRNEIFYWPPEDNPRNPALLNKVSRILNPPGHSSCVTATGDERSVIFATSEGPKGLKTLVYLSFDPAAKFLGVSRGGDGDRGDLLGQRDMSASQGEAKGSPMDQEAEMSRTAPPTESIMAKDKGKEIATGDGPRSLSPLYVSADFTATNFSKHMLTPPDGGTVWAWVEMAMHHVISSDNKFTFARSRQRDPEL